MEVNTGRTVAVVARELGINEATLGRWVTLRSDQLGAVGAPLSDSNELVSLRREVGELQLDRSLLKKAHSLNAVRTTRNETTR